MKIRFVAETDEKLHGAAYKKGDTVDLPFTSAHRWVRRALAVEVKPEPEGVRLKGRPMMGPKPEQFGTRAAEPEAEEKPKAEDKPKRGRPKKDA